MLLVSPIYVEFHAALIGLDLLTDCCMTVSKTVGRLFGNCSSTRLGHPSDCRVSANREPEELSLCVDTT